MTHSTPKTSGGLWSRWAKPVAVSIGAAILLGIGISWFPEPPPAPRFVGAANESPRDGGVLRFGESSNIHTLDPHISYDVLGTAATRLMFDGLLDYDYDANLIPSLAEALPEIADEGRRYTFRLREGVTFHNGRKLTADDVVWSLHRLLSEELGSPGYPFYKSIDGAEAYHKGDTDSIPGIRALDERTVEFRLAEPDMTFLNVIAMPFSYPIPREEVEAAETKYGKGGFGTHPVGTGPFSFVRWERGVEVEFKRYDAYWNRIPRPDGVVFAENVPSHLATARLRNGEFDIHYRPVRAETLFFMEADAWQPYMARYASPSTYALVLNCGLEPFDNVHVRRAVSFAIDRGKFQKFDPVRYMPADQLLPPSMPGHDPKLEERQIHDPAKAKEELRLAGYPDGLPDPITIWVRTDGEQQLTELMQEDLRQVGIKVNIKRVSFATYLKETGRPRVAQAAFSGWHADFPDPSNFMDILFHSRAIHPENSENRAFYSNPKLDTLLDEARRTVDSEKRMAMYHTAANVLSHDAPWVYLDYPIDTFVWQPYVMNFQVHPVWAMHYRDIWLDLPRRRVTPDEFAATGAKP